MIEIDVTHSATYISGEGTFPVPPHVAAVPPTGTPGPTGTCRTPPTSSNIDGGGARASTAEVGAALETTAGEITRLQFFVK